MKSILYQLYNGDIHPSEDYSASPEYRTLDEEFARASDAFSDKLGKELAKEYEHLLDVHTDLFALQEMDTYVRGMRFGAQLVLELLECEKIRAR